MGPKELQAARRALGGVRVIELNPSDLKEGETTKTLAVSIDGGVTDALGRLASAGLIPWPNDPESQAPLVVESSVTFMRGEGPGRYEASGVIVLTDRPGASPTDADAPTL